jgi:23S rRNA pseudouridine2604 synthase
VHPPLPSVPSHRTGGDTHGAGVERLSKRMASLGLASRREADAWIEAGWVRVDDRVATLGEKVGPSAHITIDPRARAHQGSKVTVLLHKPLGYVSGQAEDGHADAAELIVPKTRWHGDDDPRRFEPRHLVGLAPAGRLDLDSTGLLVLTQDGRIARRLIGDGREVDKEYLVDADARDSHAWSSNALNALRHGLELDGVRLQPALVERVEFDPQTSTGRLRFVLREGRKRQIRRMAELVGLRVTRLVRVRIGRVGLGELPPGCWRYLRDDESF